jgi:hypothetical protein
MVSTSGLMTIVFADGLKLQAEIAAAMFAPGSLTEC